MDSQAWLDAVEQAKQNAATVVNAGGEIFYATDANWEILRQQLVEFRIDRNMWTNYSIWVSAIMGARADGTLQNRPTVNEQAREREIKDRAPGQQRFRRDGDSKPEQFGDITSPFESITNLLTGKKADKAEAAKDAVAWPSLAADYDQLPADQKKLFQSLSADNMKKWLARRREIVREEAKTVAGINTNNLRLQGE
jgi:hypothetical protein